MIRQITLEELTSAPEFDDLAEAYRVEAAIDDLPMPTYEAHIYRSMEAAGLLHILSAHQGDRLIGFLSLIVSVLPHYGMTCATAESYFVDARHRRGGAGIKLLRKAESLSEELGAGGLLLSARTDRPPSVILPRSGHAPANTVYYWRPGA